MVQYKEGVSNSKSPETYFLIQTIYFTSDFADTMFIVAETKSYLIIKKKLDGVGPVDNRPSTD